MGHLDGRVVVITGGGTGIGMGLAEGIGDAGGTIVIWSRTSTRNKAAVAHLASRGITASSVACDTGDESSVEAAMAETLRTHGRVDSLFANAGTADHVTIVKSSLERWRSVLNTNLDGAFLATRAAARHFVERDEGGSLVLVSSIITHVAGVGTGAYAASKDGMLGLGRTLAVELARHQVRVNMLLPGWVSTELSSSQEANDAFHAATTARTPVKRWADPAEFRAVGAFLADPTLTFHTGNEVVVDGGYTIF